MVRFETMRHRLIWSWGSATGRKRCKKPGRLGFWNNRKLCILVTGVDHTWVIYSVWSTPVISIFIGHFYFFRAMVSVHYGLAICSNQMLDTIRHLLPAASAAVWNCMDGAVYPNPWCLGIQGLWWLQLPVIPFATQCNLGSRLSLSQILDHHCRHLSGFRRIRLNDEIICRGTRTWADNRLDKYLTAFHTISLS